MTYSAQLSVGGRVGGGQFGDVFEGQDPVHGKVAVKVLKQAPGESTAEWAKRSENLLKEAQNLKAASHSNVVHVHNVVKHSATDVVHLVAEFCDGGSVETDYKSGPFSLPVVRKIVTEACRGLEHIHSRGMIHRDIKPGNILEPVPKGRISGK
jgi:serine/threonine-protein kinase